MGRGQLLPDDVVSAIVFDRLAEPDAADGVVLDGYPRTIEQARTLGTWLAGRGKSVSAAVYLDVPEDELVRRLISRGRVSGRSDDHAAVAAQRLEVFRRELPPVLEHYRERGLLRTVDGARSIDDVHRQVMQALSAGSASGAG